jgi:osmoprotectant transport system ATP-binding protein
MIKLRGVSKAHNGVAAVERVDLVLAARRTTALIGPSGSGKSTLLGLIVGLDTPDEGAIEIDGRLLTPRSAQHLRRRMGYVIQDGGLFPHLTARDNVRLMARELGWPLDRQKSRLEELCALTRLPSATLDRYPAEMSGGQRQRVSLMRALMLDPDVLLMDEPLGALDPMIRADLQEDLKAIFERLAKTVVLVTHDLVEAGFFAETIVLLNRGRIVQQGSFRELLDSPADAFVGQFVRASTRRLLDAMPSVEAAEARRQ